MTNDPHENDMHAGELARAAMERLIEVAVEEVALEHVQVLLDVEEFGAVRAIRERRRREAEAAERRAATARDRVAFWRGDMWVQRDRVPIRVADMTPNHAANSIKWACHLYDLDARRYPEYLAHPATPARHPSPLINALVRRSAQRPTVRDRYDDRRARRRFQRFSAEKQARHLRQRDALLDDEEWS